jgi:hypothetical protein
MQVVNWELNLFISNFPLPLFNKEGNVFNPFSDITPTFLKGDAGGLLIFIEIELQ